MDKVNDDHAPIIITRQQGRPVVMMSLEDFETWLETDYLLRSPANARRLPQSVEQDRQGLAEPRALVDTEESAAHMLYAKGPGGAHRRVGCGPGHGEADQPAHRGERS